MKGYAAVLAVAMMFAACGGGGSDEEQIETTIKDYMAAIRDGDGDEACSHLTDEARNKMEGALAVMVGETSCDALAKVIDRLAKEDTGELAKLDEVEVEVEGIEVYGETATAYPTSLGERGDLVKLQRVDGAWKIDQDFFDGR